MKNFKVGDKVRCTLFHANGSMFNVGDIITIIGKQGNSYKATHKIIGEWWINSEYIELVEKKFNIVKPYPLVAFLEGLK